MNRGKSPLAEVPDEGIFGVEDRLNKRSAALETLPAALALAATRAFSKTHD